MDFDKNVPIYVQIMDEIKRRIFSGELGEDGKLPSVRELADELQVNPNTAVRAYQELEREGVTETRRGTGTFALATDDAGKELARHKQLAAHTRAYVQKMRDSSATDAEITDYVATVLKNASQEGTEKE